MSWSKVRALEKEMSFSFASPTPRRRRASAVAVAVALAVQALVLLPSGAAAPPVYSDGFETGASGWTATGLWNLTSERAHEGNVSWYYGISTGPGTDDNHFSTGNESNSGTLTSPAIDLTGIPHARLSYWQFWDGEGCPYEHPVVQVLASSGNGTSVTTVHENCAGSGAGVQHVNLSAFAGQVVQIRFLWDTVDGAVNEGEGWYVDSVQVHAEALPAPDVDLTSSHPWLNEPVLVVGDQAVFAAHVQNLGTETASSFAVHFRVDDVVVATDWFGGLGGKEWTETRGQWTATPGWHFLAVEVDAKHEVTEKDEDNNVHGTWFYVHTHVVDITVDVTRVEKSAIQTDHGDIQPHPLARHVIDVEVCNEGTRNATFASLQVVAMGKATTEEMSGPYTETHIASVELEDIAIGECETRTFTWDAYGSVGDVVIQASAWSWPERDTEDNVDTEDSFVLVGGLGGVVNPF